MVDNKTTSKMKRNKDFTSDAVKESAQATMTKVVGYFGKHWAPGKEYNVIKHIQGLLDAELDKYMTPSQAGNAYRKLAAYTGSKKYDAAYAKNLEQYGPYLMPLLVEYADSIVLKGRYDVGERYDEVSSDILDRMQKDFLSKESIEKMIDTETEAIDKFMAQHGVEDYSITNGTIGLAVIVNGDITLTRKDAPRGTFRHDFKKVTGDFVCSDCGLTGLLFGPEEVGGDFDCSNNKLSSLSNAPKVVGGNFYCRGNEKQFTYTEIKEHTKVGGLIYTDAELTPEELKDFKQRVTREQNEFLAQYRAVGRKLEKAIEAGNVPVIEECRAYFYDAVDFFKQRPWLTAQGMQLSYQILMKAFCHLHELAPEKYPDFFAEECHVSKLTEKFKYPNNWDW